jgi:hypothetical protein
MARRYVTIWNRIKAEGKAEITVSKAAARTVENGVKEAKTIENVARRKMGMIGWSKLVISREVLSDTHVKITFSFLYSTDV